MYVYIYLYNVIKLTLRSAPDEAHVTQRCAHE